MPSPVLPTRIFTIGSFTKCVMAYFGASVLNVDDLGLHLILAHLEYGTQKVVNFASNFWLDFCLQKFSSEHKSDTMCRQRDACISRGWQSFLSFTANECCSLPGVTGVSLIWQASTESWTFCHTFFRLSRNLDENNFKLSNLFKPLLTPVNPKVITTNN